MSNVPLARKVNLSAPACLRRVDRLKKLGLITGNGTIIHLAGARFVDAAKVDARHVPYKNVGAQLTDIAE